ncbi:MAG: DUF5074 domain-containing protein [Bacteroidota bacterium]
MGREDYKALKYLLVCLCILWASCVKDKPSDIYHPTPTNTTGNVYIVCEGMYGAGNAALSLYQPSKDCVYDDIFYSINHQTLGDVFQSMTPIGDKYFLCINHSDLIVVIQKSTWQLLTTINVHQPRYILPISDTKAYVSSLYSKKVYVINPQSMHLTDSFNMPYSNTEGMLLYNNAFLATWDIRSNILYSINTSTDQIEQSITLAGNAPQEVLLDKDNNIWVLSGNIDSGKRSTFTRLDPNSGQAFKYYTFSDSTVDAIKPLMNKTKDTIYFIEVNYSGKAQNNGIYRMSIYDDALPTTPFIAAKTNQYFWALGIEPKTGNIYVGDPKGFYQKGTVYIYNGAGTLQKQFNVGTGPGHFYFDE